MSYKRHHMQISRSRNLEKIQEWIRDSNGQAVNMNELIRKCMLVFGCTRRKAIEYIEVVTGE